MSEAIKLFFEAIGIALAVFIGLFGVAVIVLVLSQTSEEDGSIEDKGFPASRGKK